MELFFTAADAEEKLSFMASMRQRISVSGSTPPQIQRKSSHLWLRAV